MHIFDAALISNLTSKGRRAPDRSDLPEAPMPRAGTLARPLAAFAAVGLVVSALELASTASPAPLAAQPVAVATITISGLSSFSGDLSKLP